MLTDASTTVWVESLAAGLAKEGQMCAMQTSSQLQSGFQVEVFFLAVLKPCAPVNTNEKTQNVLIGGEQQVIAFYKVVSCLMLKL